MIKIQNLTKTFSTKNQSDVEALSDINLTIYDGDIFGIIGMSGAGKSTLVRSINMLEKPTSGNIFIDDLDITKLSEKELRNVRKNITMIFQSFNLLQQRNCLKNICFPLELLGYRKSDAEKKAYELLELVGLKDKAKSYPVQLSGGQQQRIAIARALATNPKVLLCDEATSALDPSTTASILDLIKEINKKFGITVVVITHQMSVVERICKRVAIMEKGKIVESGTVEQIFTNPQSSAGKLLVAPESFGDTKNLVKENSLRIVFNGSDAANKSLVAELAIKKNICANISFASTKTIGEKAYGSMILSFANADEKNGAKEFLSDFENIVVEDLEK